MIVGTWFDSSMTMSTRVGKVCSKAFRGLHSIRNIRKYLSEQVIKILDTSFLDYCNSLLYGIPHYQPDRLQRVFNLTACLVSWFDRITPTPIKLHWLPIKFRIQFKVAPLVYKALNGYGPPPNWHTFSRSTLQVVIRYGLIQASRVSVSFVKSCALWDRKWAPSLEWQPYLCLLYGNIVTIWYEVPIFV